jgi:predicted TIM-barrel fold metal-dependent hydrolase
MQPPCPVFDAHVHTYPDAIAQRVVSDLGARFFDPQGRPGYDGTRAGLLARLAAGGIAGALNAPIATRPDQTVSINNWAAAGNRWPVLSLGTVHPDQPDVAAELRRVRDLGLPGIKLHPEYQSFAPDEPRLDPVWRTCRDLGLTVLLHAGGDRAFRPPFRATPTVVGRVVRAWPGLTLVAAHLGGFQMWDEFERELAGQPLHLDTSYTIGFLPDEQFLRIVRRHGVARILFGSDGPWQDPAEALANFRRLPLTPAEQRAILWENAARILPLPSHPPCAPPPRP